MASRPPGAALFRRLFIANRGEVAARVARTCDALGIVPVFAVSEADRDAKYLKGRETVCVGPAHSADSYLNLEAMVQAAVQSRCTAVHPGWGFLAENARFAALCEAHGLTFIGPPPSVMLSLGKKIPAKQAMAAAGLKGIPGSDGLLHSDVAAAAAAAECGYPVIVKADSGGGGRGMRVANDEQELREAVRDAQREALSAFGDPAVYLEKLILGGRHVEVQIIADRYGNVCHLGERDCSVQRKHQKLIEESPCPVLDDGERQRTFPAAIKAVADVGYVGAGTLEFLLDNDGHLWFMEMNARLQVEHSVSEMRTGIDLVAEQIRVAAGHRLSFTQDEVKLEGCALECRINAEDPFDDFRPTPGTLETWRTPAEVPGELRVDTHLHEGDTIPPYYDSLLCKVISREPTRDGAIDRMLTALADLECKGVPTTVPLHKAVIDSKDFRDSNYDTRTIPGWPPAQHDETTTRDDTTERK